MLGLFVMNGTGWAQLAIVVVALLILSPLLGRYLAAVFGDDRRAPGDKIFGPIERLVYRACGVDPDREQRWTTYAFSVLAFSAVSVLGLYLLQRVQGVLPWNQGKVGVTPSVAWNTAVSFVTNTNWQSYSGESTMAHLTQAVGLTVQNFVSAAVGMAVAIALVRGLIRARKGTIGNFWVDLVRGVTRVLVPICLVLAVVFIGAGVVQNFHGDRTVTTVQGAKQAIPGGLVASQEAIKQLGTNGGGFYNANSSHPFENPNGFTNVLQIIALLVIPFALCFAFGRMAKDKRQGYVVFAAMFILWLGAGLIAMNAESNGNPKLTKLGVDQSITAQQPGGSMEGKEVRYGPATCALFASSTTGTSTGAVDCAHDSLTPIGGAVPLANMMLSEVSPGGVGSGLYGMLIFVLTAVFIAGLMVGRTPEYLGKRIQASEVKLVVLYILFVPLVVLGFSAVSVLIGPALAGRANPGAHGLSEILYAHVSAGNNNGSAFAGLTVTSWWYQITLGISMLVGRFFLMVPALAIAGSLVRKKKVPPSAGTFPTGNALFAGLLVGVVLIVVGLTYFPALALGPIVEHLAI
jgi:potassium-transporting ATPase potassium-binding subunit